MALNSYKNNYTRITVNTQKLKVLKENCVAESSGEEEKTTVVVEWKPPELKPKGSMTGVKVVTGLAVVFEDDNPRRNVS
ncbi:hypothetical protein P8452_08346 [Trifolium repens]|nr:hypothetical protein P8452_08346 [Trifolium repens]